MASSEASTAASSKEVKNRERLIDVMFLCDEWKSSKGGLSTFNREFAINLAQTTTGSMKIHCYVSKSDDQDKEDAKQHNVKLITAQSVPFSADPFECLKFPPSELPNPHLIIGHGRKFGGPAYFLVKTTKCKWIQFVHVYCEDLGKYKKTMAATDTIEENEKKHKIELDLCKVADAVVAVGSRLQQKYSRSLPNVKVEIITPGIFENFSSESQCAMHKSFLKNFNVFLFGRATFEDLSLKGYDIVANAIGSLGERFELTFVGSSPGEHKNVEEWFLKETCINPNQLYIRGYCNNPEEVKTMFYQSDLVALPSRTEGFGLVALEAISAAVPVLVSGESGIAEALRKVEGGRTVIVGSYKDVDEARDEWARRIREMSEESAEERESNARKLCENYRKVYSWKAECTRFKEMIESVMESVNDGKSNIKVDVEHVKPADYHSSAPPVSRMEPAGRQKASTAPGTNRKRQSDTDLGDLQPLKEKILCRIAMNYLDTTPPQSSEEHNKFMEYLEKMRVVITGVSVGSLVITVKCDSLKSLEELWENYSCGLLDKMVQDCFVTENILKELNLAELKLKTTMDIEEYNACKLYLEKVALRDALSAQSYFISTEDEAQLERRRQNTEIVESEEVKSSSPILEMSTTGHDKEGEGPQETMKGISPLTLSSSSDSDDDSELEGRLKTFTLQEEKRILPPAEEDLEELLVKLQSMKGILPPSEEELEELLMKLQSMKGTSLSTKLSTAGHGKELEGRLKTMTLQEEKRTWPVLEFSASDPEEDLAKLRMKPHGMEVSSFSVGSCTAGHKKELEGEEKTMNLLEKEGSLPSSPLSTTDLEEKLEEVCVKLIRLRKEGKLAVPESSTSHLVKKLAELCMELIRLRMEGTLPPPDLFTANLEDQVEDLQKILDRQRYYLYRGIDTFEGDVRELLRQQQEKRTEGSLPVPESSTSDLVEKLPELCMELIRPGMGGTLPPPDLFTANLEEQQEDLQVKLDRQRYHLYRSIETFEGDVTELLRQLQEERTEVYRLIDTLEGDVTELLKQLPEKRTEALENAMYPTIRSGLAKFDVSLPEELQSYVSYLFNESAKLGFRKRALHSLSSVEELREAMDKYKLKTFLRIHITEGAWQVALLFMDELPSDELPRDWFVDAWYRWEEEEEMIGSSLYSSTSGILKAWPTEYDPDLVTLCKAITDRFWKVTRLILFGSWISEEGLKNLGTALTQGKLYSLTLCRSGLQSQRLEHLCEALTSVNCNLTSLNFSDNRLGDEEIMRLSNVLTSVNCKLTSLNVSDNELGDEGTMRLCNVLTSVNCKLTSLNVSGNYCGSEGLNHLCDALVSTNCTLTSLNVSSNRFRDEDIMDLFTVLTSTNCTLTSLDVSWSEAGDRAVKELARALTSKNCVLTSLDISRSEIGDEGIKYLCKALTDPNCKLRSLDLRENWKVTDVGKQFLSEAITGTDWEVREGLSLFRSIKSEA